MDAREDTNETPGIIINRCDDDKSAIAERYCVAGDTALFFFFFPPPLSFFFIFFLFLVAFSVERSILQHKTDEWAEREFYYVVLEIPESIESLRAS